MHEVTKQAIRSAIKWLDYHIRCLDESGPIGEQSENWLKQYKRDREMLKEDYDKYSHSI